MNRTINCKKGPGNRSCQPQAGVTTPVFPGTHRSGSLQTQPSRGGRSAILRHRPVSTKPDHTWWEREGAGPAPAQLTNGTEGGSHRVSRNHRDDPDSLGWSYARERLHHRSLGGRWAGQTVWSGAERQTETQSGRRWRQLLWWQRRSPRSQWAQKARPRCTGSAKDYGSTTTRRC